MALSKTYIQVLQAVDYWVQMPAGAELTRALRELLVDLP